MRHENTIKEFLKEIFGQYGILKTRIVEDEDDLSPDEDENVYIVTVSNINNKGLVSFRLLTDGDDISFRFEGQEEWEEFDESERFLMCLFIQIFC